MNKNINIYNNLPYQIVARQCFFINTPNLKSMGETIIKEEELSFRKDVNNIGNYMKLSKTFFVFVLILIFSTQNVLASTCREDEVFDGTLNRCIQSQTATEIQNATRGCMSITDETQRKACYVQNAQSKLDASGKEAVDSTYISDKFIGGNSKNIQGITIAAVGLVASVWALIAAKTKIPTCQSPALWLMLGGAVAAATSEVTGWLMFKNGLKKLDEEYAYLGKETNSSSLDQQKIDAKNAQEQAFEYMARKEDLLKKVANTKGGIYAASAAMYAAAAVISAVEVVKQAYGSDSTCNMPEKADGGGGGILGLLGSATSIGGKKKQSSDDNTPTENERSGDQDSGGSDTGTEVVKSQAGVISRTLVSPVTRLVANGVFAGFATSLSVHAFKQAKLAKDRAVFLRGLKAEFAEGGGLTECTPRDRDYPEKASCFCYYEDNTPRSDRENSALCQKKWNRDYQVANAGSYETYNPYSNGPYGCVDRQMNFDEKCKCRDKKLRNGENNCMKVKPSLSGFGNLASANWMADTKSNLDKITNGNADQLALNGQSNLKKAAKLLKMSDDIIAKKASDKIKNKIKKFEDSLKKRLTTYPKKTLASLGRNLGNGGYKKAVAPGLDSDLVDKLQKKLDLTKGEQTIASGGKAKIRTGVEDFDLSMDADGQAEVVVDNTSMDAIMKKNYNIGDSDINKDTSRSLFQVLSLRYQVSGLRRLFGQDGMPAKIEDAPPSAEK